MVIGSNAASFHSVSRMFCARNGKPSFSVIALTRSAPSVNSQWPTMASGFSSAMQSTMSWPLAAHGRVAVLPGVAAVEEHGAVAALGADGFQHGRDAVEAAEPAVALGERRKILRGQRIGRRAAGRDLVEIEEVAPRDMRHLSARVADAEIDRRLAKQHRHELRVNVGQVDESDVAECFEGKQVRLRQPLLRERARPSARRDCRRRRRDLDEFAPGDHSRLRADGAPVRAPAMMWHCS